MRIDYYLVSLAAIFIPLEMVPSKLNLSAEQRHPSEQKPISSHPTYRFSRETS